MMNPRLLAALALALFVPRQVVAQSPVVAIQVIDDATDAPLPDVRVTIVGEPLEGVTDAKGRCFVLARKAGKLPVLLRKLGYAPGSMMIDVSATDTTRVTFAMTSSVQTLGTVAVRDTMNRRSSMLDGFHHRLSLPNGSARFITQEMIEAQRPLRTLDLLRTIPSIEIVHNGDTGVPSSRRGVKIGTAPCPLQIGVDGSLKAAGFDINMIPVTEIYGIEVYPGPATVPREFASTRRESGCGLVMIWTRRR
jgi:TonB-dependent receptor-like protein